MAGEFRLPELGENVAKATVVKVLVSAGDTVAVDQPVLEIETDKAAAEVPCSVGGTVSEVLVKAGDVIRPGAVVLRTEGAAPAAQPVAPVAAPRPAPAAPPPAAPAARKTVPPSAGAPAPAPLARAPGQALAAGPGVRRLAREIGVDLALVPGSGPGGRITAEDVKDYARRVNVEAPKTPQAATPQPDAAAAPSDGSQAADRWGPVEVQPMSGVRRRTAEHMTHCWTTIPHVTHFDEADVTQLEQLRQKHGKAVEAAGGKLTMTAILVKVTALALRKSPEINASVDMENGTIILKHYCNIGVAVDTDRGLLVPVVRNADQKSVLQIAIELQALADRARARKLTLDDMQGGTFTISNLGGIGGTAFTPIVNAPEVAILGVARAQWKPTVREGDTVPRLILPLALSYDHRVIDGADAARFLRLIAAVLEDPFLLMLEL